MKWRNLLIIRQILRHILESSDVFCWWLDHYDATNISNAFPYLVQLIIEHFWKIYKNCLQQISWSQKLTIDDKLIDFFEKGGWGGGGGEFGKKDIKSQMDRKHSGNALKLVCLCQADFVKFLYPVLMQNGSQLKCKRLTMKFHKYIELIGVLKFCIPCIQSK